MIINIAVSQFSPSLDVDENYEKIVKMVSKVNENDILVLPEGCLSGYSHELDFLIDQTAVQVENALLELEKVAVDHRVHLILGSLIKEGNLWYNAGLYLSPEGVRQIYRKVNLAVHERELLAEGQELTNLNLSINNRPVKAAIQLCREIRFPEQWKFLSVNGAEIIFYLTNVVGAEKREVWDAHLISRAAENQRFIVSSNIMDPYQGCSSMVVSPDGKVLGRLKDEEESLIRIQVDLAQNSDWYLNQGREDLLKIVRGH